jgi:hypothetical protein
MELHEQDSFPRAYDSSSRALGIVTAIVVAASFAMVAAWFALLLMDERRPAAQFGSASGPEFISCRICGVVDRVSEVEPAPRQALEGSSAEGAVILLAALGGARASQPARIYETSVVHDDGTVRVLQEWRVPHWKAGDRVRVIKGRVIVGTEEQGASQEGRR